jgi:hypothetical protein
VVDLRSALCEAEISVLRSTVMAQCLLRTDFRLFRVYAFAALTETKDYCGWELVTWTRSTCR